jgi:hypothetical protein
MLPIEKALVSYLAHSGVIGSNVLFAVECLRQFSPSWHQDFRCLCLYGHISAPGLLSITTASADFPSGCPVGISPGKNALLHSATAAFTSVTEPSTLLCCASSSHHVGLSMRFLFIGPPLSSSLPPSGKLPFRTWLRVVVMFSCLHE